MMTIDIVLFKKKFTVHLHRAALRVDRAWELGPGVYVARIQGLQKGNEWIFGFYYDSHEISLSHINSLSSTLRTIVLSGYVADTLSRKDEAVCVSFFHLAGTYGDCPVRDVTHARSIAIHLLHPIRHTQIRWFEFPQMVLW